MEPQPSGADGPVESWWGLGDVWITLALYLFFAILGGVMVLGAPDNPDAKAWALVASVVLPWVGLAGWPLFATATKGRGPVADLRLRASGGALLFGAAMGVVGLLIATTIAAITERLLGDPLESSVGQLADEIADASPWPLIVLALLAVFVAPVVEEIAFRGLAFGALEKRAWRPWSSVLVSSALFAAFHLEITRFALLFAVGLILGFVRARTASTSASMATHMVNNLPGAVALIALALG